MKWDPTLRGRGASYNPPNRFDKLHIEFENDDVYPGVDDDQVVPLRTTHLKMSSRTILTRNDSPDFAFEWSINPMAGCSHGCSYCFARTYYEFWGLSPGLDFETKILIKENAAELLRNELMSKKWTPAVIAMSGVTDLYQPSERLVKVTRRCLEVLAEFRNPVVIITKNRLITRDLDILSAMAAWGGVGVFLSITTLDEELATRMEPRASRPQARLDTIRALAGAGVPVGVNAAPLIPGLTDHELPAILKASAEAGATFASYDLVRLPGAVEEIFSEWLDRNYPNSKNKVMNRICEIHGGKANNSRSGLETKGTGQHAAQIKALFRNGCRRLGLQERMPELSTSAFRRPPRDGQQDLFEL